MRFEICKKCGTQKGKKYSENGCSTMTCRNCDLQDEIQSDNTSMEEKLAMLNEVDRELDKLLEDGLCVFCEVRTNGYYTICESCVSMIKNS